MSNREVALERAKLYVVLDRLSDFREAAVSRIPALANGEAYAKLSAVLTDEKALTALAEKRLGEDPHLAKLAGAPAAVAARAKSAETPKPASVRKRKG